MSRGFYKCVRGVARGLRALLYPLDVEGRENLDIEGGAMIVCNHISLRDPILLACLCKRPLRFMGKKELFENKLAGSFLRSLGGFPVDRGAADISSIRESVNVLKGGDILMIFPQGHRFPDDSGREIKDGASLLAIWSKVPVIPVHIQPPYRAFRKLKVRVGSPIDLTGISDIDQTSLKEASRRIEKGIWAE